MAAKPLASLAQSPFLATDVEGHRWHIQAYYDRPLYPYALPHPALGVPEPYLLFAGGKLEGSPGCGKIGGTYQIRDGRFAIQATWSDDSEAPCRPAAANAARLVLEKLAKVRLAAALKFSPTAGSLWLYDEKGEDQLMLLLSQLHSGKDLSELHDTFWTVATVNGVEREFPGLVISVDDSGLKFAVASSSWHYRTEYKDTGLEFISPPLTEIPPVIKAELDGPADAVPQKDRGLIEIWRKATDARVQAMHATEELDHSLHSVKSYVRKGDTLTFFDQDAHPVLVLRSIMNAGIENRRWRIVKLPSDDWGPDFNGDAWIVLSNGRIEGALGCGKNMGTYSLSDGVLTWQLQGIITGPGCSNLNEAYLNETYKPPTAAEQEAAHGPFKVEESKTGFILRGGDGTAYYELVPF